MAPDGPRRTLSVHIESHRGGQLAFDATLALRRHELTRASLARMTARYPLATLRVLALIYAHGVALKLKGVPLHPPHPAPTRFSAAGDRPAHMDAASARPARALANALLGRIQVGSLTVVEDGRRRVFGAGAPAATVDVHSPRVWPLLLRGSRGLAESYAQGLWESPDLTAVIRVAARNAHRLDRVRMRLAPLWPPCSAPARSPCATRACAAVAT